jgi:erythromycin esterase
VINDKLTTLGQHLAGSLGDDLVVIGTAFGGGTLALHRPLLDGPPGHTELFTQDVGPFEPDTIDAELSAVGLPLHLTDLRQARSVAATKIMLDSQSYPVDPVAAFDAVVYIDAVTPWHAFPTA